MRERVSGPPVRGDNVGKGLPRRTRLEAYLERTRLAMLCGYKYAVEPSKCITTFLTLPSLTRSLVVLLNALLQHITRSPDTAVCTEASLGNKPVPPVCQ